MVILTIIVFALLLWIIQRTERKIRILKKRLIYNLMTIENLTKRIKTIEDNFEKYALLADENWHQAEDRISSLERKSKKT